MKNIKLRSSEKSFIKQKGGSGRVIPDYKDVRNTPFKSNQQKETDELEKKEKQIAQDNYKKMLDLKNPTNTLLELKINEPRQQPPPNYGLPWVPVPNPTNPLAFMGQQNPYNQYPQYGYQQQPGTYMLNPPYNYPVIKKYNISLGPTGDFTKIADIYEDVLPTGLSISHHSFNTLKERKNVNDYVRGMFIKTGDGEEIMLGGSINDQTTNYQLKNLLSHLKLLEINPYHFHRLTNNPYRTLPTNFCMYRSCYPIKLDNNNSITCARNNIGMHIRIYGVTSYDEIQNKKGGLDRLKCDLWRELEYYTYMRQEVLKNNISPNFIQMYAHYRAKNVGINFNKFELLRNHINVKDFDIEKNNLTIRNKEFQKEMLEIISDVNNKQLINDLIKYKLLTREEAQIPDLVKLKLEDLMKNNKLDKIKMYDFKSDKIKDDNIIILSEAPTQNIYNWATKTYQLGNDPQKIMVQSGYHSNEEWESVIFQLLTCFMILFDKEIMFNEFTLDSNVFIKDLQYDANKIGYWKYIIRNMEYHVPNLGYLLTIDSSYKDLNDVHSRTTSLAYKILCTKWGDDKKLIIEKTLDNMLGCFNSVNFGGDFVQFGGQKPHQEILDLLNNINKEVNEIKIHYDGNKLRMNIDDLYTELKNKLYDIPITIISKGNFVYLHNRVGTLVKELEEKLLVNYGVGRQLNGQKRHIKKGELVACFLNRDTKIYGISLNENGANVEVLITSEIVVNSNDKITYITREFPKGSIYFIMGNVEQNYKAGTNYSEIETYRI